MTTTLRIGTVEMAYELEVGPEGIGLSLSTAGGRFFDGRLHLRHPVEVHVSELGATRSGHRLLPAVGPPHVAFLPPGRRLAAYRGHEHDLFRRALAFGRRVAGTEGSPSGDPGGLLALRRLLDDAARAALQRVDPEAWRVARHFHPLARLHVLRHLLADTSGRLGQLAVTCPGLLLVTAELEAQGGALGEECRQLLKWIVSGRPLRQLLLMAAMVILEREVNLGTPAEGGRETLVLNSLGEGTVESCGDRLRLLIRRAGPRVSPWDVCGLPPPHLVPEDIPSGSSNATWFAATRVVWDEWLRHEVPSPAWSFLSRSATELTRAFLAGWPIGDLGDPRGAARALAWQVVQRGAATGDWPRRYTRPYSLLATLQVAAAVPAEGIGSAHRLGALLERVRKLGLGDVVGIELLDPDKSGPGTVALDFPGFPGPVPHLSSSNLQAVSTPLELAALGRTMDNCVATWCGKLAEGSVWIFGGQLAGESATVEVIRTGAGYCIREALGVGNRPLGEPARIALRRWIRQLNVLQIRRITRTSATSAGERALPTAPSQLALPLGAEP